MTKEHLCNFHIAGFTYYEGVEVFEQLKIGKKLKFVLDTQNKYDPRAVAIYYEKYKLGFVPKTENRIIYKLLTVGYKGLEIRVQRIVPEEHPESQVAAVVHLVG